MSQFTIYQGERRSLEISLRDSQGESFDLSGWNVDFLAVRGSESISKSVGDGVTVADPSSGLITVALTPEDTSGGPGPWSVEVRISDDENAVTVYRGTMDLRRSLFASEGS